MKLLVSSPTRALLIVFLSLVGVLAGSPSAHAFVGASRTWMSGVGDDANPCTRTAPCKTLAGAFSKTNDGGEINALDSAGFGAVTITRSVTIDLSGTLGGILNASTSGVIIDAAAGNTVDVVLRGLDIYGASNTLPQPLTDSCQAMGINGVDIREARSVKIENTTIASQNNAGIKVAPTAGSTLVEVSNTEVRNTCIHGLNVQPGAGASATVFAHDSNFSHAGEGSPGGVGVRADAGGMLWLKNSNVFASALGMEQVNGGSITLLEGNSFVGNGTSGVPAPPPPPVPPADTTAPESLLAPPARAELARLRKSGVSVNVSCDEPCEGTVTVKLGKRALGSATVDLDNAGVAGILIGLTPAGDRLIADTFKPKRIGTAKLSFTGRVTDTAGNADGLTGTSWVVR